jgi:hypothetical protein
LPWGTRLPEDRIEASVCWAADTDAVLDREETVVLMLARGDALFSIPVAAIEGAIEGPCEAAHVDTLPSHSGFP